jgi:hypothetical protein
MDGRYVGLSIRGGRRNKCSFNDSAQKQVLSGQWLGNPLAPSVECFNLLLILVTQSPSKAFASPLLKIACTRRASCCFPLFTESSPFGSSRGWYMASCTGRKSLPTRRILVTFKRCVPGPLTSLLVLFCSQVLLVRPLHVPDAHVLHLLRHDGRRHHAQRAAGRSPQLLHVLAVEPLLRLPHPTAKEYVVPFPDPFCSGKLRWESRPTQHVKVGPSCICVTVVLLSWCYQRRAGALSRACLKGPAIDRCLSSILWGARTRLPIVGQHRVWA